ncbi:MULTISPECIES: hypothetical protein [unclassified Shimia]|uniref:hypothetical protein n=1 Tax=unclassified Shimia TaxID=2630038 RepID=UPI001ADCCF9E|nr:MULTISPECIES: hypothetical protein [unclassified Shimia]MBO9396812.1 hypothetical protein [Shimia sp. R9_2]MBO9401741.1 hypothetical protein [Shimia sp. R9_3]
MGTTFLSKLSWRGKLALAAALLLITVQAGPAADAITNTFQKPAPIEVEMEMRPEDIC